MKTLKTHHIIIGLIGMGILGYYLLKINKPDSGSTTGAKKTDDKSEDGKVGFHGGKSSGQRILTEKEKKNNQVRYTTQHKGSY